MTEDTLFPFEDEIDLSKTKSIVCNKCGGDLWIQTQRLKFVSKETSPDGVEHILIVPTWICFTCHNEIRIENNFEKLPNVRMN